MNTPIICAGFHRSGTSLASQILHIAGLPFAIEEMPGNISNPDGYFEDLFAKRLHDDCLLDLGTTWQFHGEVDTSITSVGTAQIKAYCLLRNRLHGSMWLMKDPRATIFLNQWNNALNGEGRFLLLYRHWSLCIQSLYERHSKDLGYNLPTGKSFQQLILFWKQKDLAAQMWLAYNRALIKFVRKNPSITLVVSHQSIINGLDLIKAVNNKFGLKLKNDFKEPINHDYYESNVDSTTLYGLSESLISEMNDVYSQLNDLSFGKIKDKTPDVVRADVNLDHHIVMLKSCIKENWKKRNLITPIDESNQTLSFDGVEELDYSEIVCLLKKSIAFGSAKDLQIAVRRLIALEPFNYLSHEWAGRIGLKEKKLKEAELHFLRAISMEKSPPYLRMLLSRVYFLAYNLPAAENYLILAYNMNPNNPAFSAKLGDICFFEGRFDEAVKWYYRSIAIEKTCFKVLKLSSAIEKLKGIRSAIEIIELELECSEDRALRNRWISLMFSIRDKHALSLYKNQIRCQFTRERVDEFISNVANSNLSERDLVNFSYWLLKSLKKVLSTKEIEALLSLNSPGSLFCSTNDSNKFGSR